MWAGGEKKSGAAKNVENEYLAYEIRENKRGARNIQRDNVK